MNRTQNWEMRLDDWLKTRAGLEFTFGANDCCLFAAGAVEAMTGEDLAGKFRGKYRTKHGAQQVLKKYAGGGVRELMVRMAADHGLIEAAPPMLTRGSVALILNDGRESLGIVDLTGMAIVAPGIVGMVRMPIDRAITGWLV
jgi:hypothetical protein